MRTASQSPATFSTSRPSASYGWSPSRTRSASAIAARTFAESSVELPAIVARIADRGIAQQRGGQRLRGRRRVQQAGARSGPGASGPPAAPVYGAGASTQP